MLVVLVPCGCFSTATITRRSDPPIEARIDRSDTESLFLTSPDGEHFSVKRSEVTDIDHPGNVHATVGAVAVALGVLMLVGSTRDVSPESSIGLFMFGDAIGIAGAYLAGYGLWTYFRSVSASQASSPAVALDRGQAPPRLTGPFCGGVQRVEHGALGSAPMTGRDAAPLAHLRLESRLLRDESDLASQRTEERGFGGTILEEWGHAGSP
jgi:hypothetical protein